MTGLQLSKMTNAQKIIVVGTLARADMRKTGVLASITLAQGILETGWFKSELCVKANALFGIKVGTGWTGAKYSVDTKEVYDGVTTTVNAAFRAYNSVGDSISDHSNYLTTSKKGSELRYKGLVGETDYKKVAQILVDGGYATGTNYAEHLCTLIEQYDLTQYDNVTVGTAKVTTTANKTVTTVTEGVTNMSLNIQACYGKDYNLTYKANRTINYIVLHYTAGTSSKKGNAYNNCKYFTTANRSASADFFVDDETVWQFNPNLKNYYTWAVGDSSAGKYGNSCYNNNSISIEICSNNKTGKVTTAGDSNWYFTDAELALTWELVKYLMKQFNLTYDKVITHYLRSTKTCPGVVGWSGTNQTKYIAFRDSLKSNTNPYTGTTTTNVTTSTTSTTSTSTIKFTPSAKEVVLTAATPLYADSTKTVLVTTIPKGTRVYCYGKIHNMTLLTYKSTAGDYVSGVASVDCGTQTLHYQWWRVKQGYDVYSSINCTTKVGGLDAQDQIYIYNQFNGKTLCAYWLDSAKSKYKFGVIDDTFLTIV